MKYTLETLINVFEQTGNPRLMIRVLEAAKGEKKNLGSPCPKVSNIGCSSRDVRLHQRLRAHCPGCGQSWVMLKSHIPRLALNPWEVSASVVDMLWIVELLY